MFSYILTTFDRCKLYKNLTFASVSFVNIIKICVGTFGNLDINIWSRFVYVISLRVCSRWFCVLYITSALLRFSDIIFYLKSTFYISIFLLLYNNKCIICNNNNQVIRVLFYPTLGSRSTISKLAIQILMHCFKVCIYVVSVCDNVIWSVLNRSI